MTMLAPGSSVQDRYRIDHLIGQGGFGAVYEAVDERLGRRVALKQLLRISDRISRQFEREARLLANLDHPSLPSVIDHFSTPDGQFLVMQFVRGTDLADQLAQRGAPYPLGQVLAWGDQVLDVLQYLHALQPPIVHRDIKPQNIKLKADGTIMLLDFGLAKGFAGESPPSTTESSLLAYTKGYAPPEQVEGTGTDERSDLYALAATLHCLSTNVLPVEAAMRLLADARGRPDPLRPAHEIDPDIPQAVSRVLQQALELEPDRRPASAQEMRAMLRAAAGSLPLPPPQAPLLDSSAGQPKGQPGRAIGQSTTAQPSDTIGQTGPRPPFSGPGPAPTEDRQPSRPFVPASGGGRTDLPAEHITLGVPDRPAVQRQADDTPGHMTIDRSTSVPPPPPPPGPSPASNRMPRPARLAIILGGGLLAACLGGAAVAGAMGWFGGAGDDAGAPSPAASVIVLIPSPAASIAAVSASPVASEAPSQSGQPSPTASPSAAPSDRPDALVSSTRLNLRAGPGEVYAIKASYSEGTPLRVLGKLQGSNWLYVQTADGNDGWMFGDFLLVNIPLADVAVVAAPPTPRQAPTPSPTPIPLTATPTPKVSPTAPAGGDDTARIIAIWPAPGTKLSAGQPQEFQIKLQYSLQSANEAIVVLFIEQFPAGAGGCSGAQHKTNGGVQFAIQRGQGITTVQVPWNGADGSGFVSPGISFWSNSEGKPAQPLIRGFGVLGEPCYAFGT